MFTIQFPTLNVLHQGGPTYCQGAKLGNINFVLKTLTGWGRVEETFYNSYLIFVISTTDTQLPVI